MSGLYVGQDEKGIVEQFRSADNFSEVKIMRFLPLNCQVCPKFSLNPLPEAKISHFFPLDLAIGRTGTDLKGFSEDGRGFTWNSMKTIRNLPVQNPKSTKS